MIRALAVASALAAVAACGGAQPDAAAANAASATADTRTPIERRRDAACDNLGPKLTACAIEDAKADLAAGKVSQSQFDQDTASGVQQQNTAAFEKACKASHYSSRQVRVLEVCPREETQCSRLLDCLGHISDAPAR